jgi:type IV secretory pathway protease TraF
MPRYLVPCTHRSTLVLSLVVLGMSLLLALWVGRGPRLYVAISTSMPRGLYWRSAYDPKVPLRHGDLVLVAVPDAIRMMLARVEPTLMDIPLLKPVAALPGETICLTGAQVQINGVAMAHRMVATSQGFPLPWPDGCWVLAPDEFFPLSTYAPNSIDGRYLGPVVITQILGRMTVLWVTKKGGHDAWAHPVRAAGAAAGL